jgi:hypothetical protein
MTPEELEAERLKLLQAQSMIGSPNPAQDSTGSIDPTVIAGLGMGSGFVASQTGGAPATSQVLSPFAQKIAANDAARLAAQNVPGLIGTPQTYQGVPTGPNTPPQYTGTNAGRLTNGTKVATPVTFQPPAVNGTTTITTPGTQVVTQPPKKVKLTADDFDFKVGSKDPYSMGAGKKLASSLLKGAVVNAAIIPNDIGDSSLTGAYANRIAAGEDPLVVRESLGTADESITLSNGETMDNAWTRPAPLEDKGFFDYLFGAPTQEQAQEYLKTMPTDPAQRASLQATASGNGSPSEISNIANYLFGREEGGDPNVLKEGSKPFYSGAEQGSPQQIFERLRDRGNLTQEQLIGTGQKAAARLGTTFDPSTGFSQQPFLDDQAAMAAAQAEKDFLLARPGYGYAGEVNNQYSPGDFDAISKGVFDTPMTGMRPINADTGEPLSQGVIDAAARAGLELPSGSVPLPKAPVNSRPMGQDETRAALGGRTLSEYLNAPNGTEGVSGLRTDAQGRMIPGGSQTREQAYSGYEKAAAERDQRAAYDWENRGSQRGGSGGGYGGSGRGGNGGSGAPQEGSEFFNPVASQNIPTDVRQALSTPFQKRSNDQQQRLSQWEGSTQGKEMGGVAGYEESRKSPQQKQEDALQARYTEAQIARYQESDPTKYEDASSTVDNFIANGGGDPNKRTQYIASLLGLAPKETGKNNVAEYLKGSPLSNDGDLPTVLTDQDFAGLPSGARYIDSQGNRATKP